MAQPKILANLDQLKLQQFADGISYLGSISDNINLLDNVKTSGAYLFSLFNDAGEVLNLTFIEPIIDNVSMTYLYTLTVAHTQCDTKAFFDKIAIDNPINTIQIIERLGTALDEQSRDIWYREYIYNNGSWAWTSWYNGGGGGKIECDTSLSTTSTNPVQNKVVATALNNKANSTHTHSNYLTSSDITGKLDKSGGTMTGALTAQANTNYTTYQVRNIAFSTSASTPTGNGSILGVYS